MKNQWLSKVWSALLIVMLAMAALPVTPARAADVTYNFQISNGTPVTTGITTNDASACYVNPTVATITLMTTAAHGCSYQSIRPNTAGAQDILDVWFNTNYATNTTVAGTTTSLKIRLREASGPSTDTPWTAGIMLRYVNAAGVVTNFTGPEVTRVVADGSDTDYLLDLSGQSATIPAGSKLGIRIRATAGTSTNMRVYFGSKADVAGTGTSGVLTVNEVAADTTPPTVVIGAPSATLTRTGPVTYTVTYADTNFNASTLAVGNITLNTTGTATGTLAVSGTGTTRTVTINPISGDGTLGISIAAGTASDTAGNTSAAAGPSATFTVDNTGPTVAIGAPSVTVTRAGPVDFPITVAGANTINLLDGNVTLNAVGASGTITVLNGTTATPTVRISGITGDGTLGISIAAGIASDTLGNTSAAAGPSATVTVDNTAPTVAIGAPSVTVTSAGPVDFPITVTGANTINLLDGNVTLNAVGASGTITVLNGTTATPTVRISGITGNGTLGISIAAGIASDTAGNTSAAAGPSATVMVDSTSPSVTINQAGAPQLDPTTIMPINFDVAFSKPINTATFTTADITQSGTATGITWSITDSGDNMNFTLSATAVTGEGTLIPSIVAAVVQDPAGNNNTVSGSTDNSVTYVINHAPSFTKGADETVNEDAGARVVNGWATAITDGDPLLSQTLTFNITNNTNPALFSAVPSISAAGNLTYTPAANANGSATITITLSDNGGTANGGANTSAAQTFVINVTAVNDLPAFTSTPVIAATQDVVYTYDITTIDPDGNPLTITADTKPAWLTFTITGAGTATLSGTPTNSNIGPHLVVLRVTDGVISTPVEQSFTINVGDVNDAPTLTSAPITSAGESVLYTYNVVAADPDAGNTLAISATTLPSWLTLVDNGNRTATLSGTPNSSQIGVPHNVVLEVTDGTLSDNQTFTITVANTAPQVIADRINSLPDTGDGVLGNSEVAKVGITQLFVTFNQDVFDPANDGDAHDVTNPANYLLVRDNGDGFQTIDCATLVNALDTAITVDAVSYSNGGGSGPFVSTLLINGGLPLSNGNYRLFVCGTTSIVDRIDNTLELAGNGTTPGTDFTLSFTVSIANNGNTGSGSGGDKKTNKGSTASTTSGLLIPVTGFAPNQTTLLPAQPANKAYKPLNEFRIEIPTLGINFPIVGAAVSDNSWDLTWLKDSVAYLEGSAYPTLAGNTVLTAHVTDANNNLGPFSDIKGMQLGQYIYIHSNGQTFVYQVQANRRISPTNISTVFKHEEYDWITLVTCEDYNAKTKSYNYRRMVRAVLISVVPEK